MVEVDDGVRVRTWSSGVAGGLPAVVLLHGGPGMWDYLEPVADMVESLTVVHRFDQRGCGGSDPSNLHTITRYVADIEALRRQWGHESWVVVGHSFGATLAFAYAVAHPDRTAALGYVGGVGVGAWRDQYRQERRRRMTDEQWARLELLDGRVSRSRAEEVEFRALSWFTDFADPAVGWGWALADAEVDLTINVEANRLLGAEADTWPDSAVLAKANGLRMPCWFVHGGCDPRSSGPVAALAAAVPHARFDIIPAAGHQPWRERPVVVADLLRRLLTVSSSATGRVSQEVAATATTDSDHTSVHRRSSEYRVGRAAASGCVLASIADIDSTG
jgi:proline iminopeptidase